MIWNWVSTTILPPIQFLIRFNIKFWKVLPGYGTIFQPCMFQSSTAQYLFPNDSQTFVLRRPPVVNRSSTLSMTQANFWVSEGHGWSPANHQNHTDFFMNFKRKDPRCHSFYPMFLALHRFIHLLFFCLCCMPPIIIFWSSFAFSCLVFLSRLPEKCTAIYKNNIFLSSSHQSPSCESRLR